MSYTVAGGRILTWSLEAHLTDHCNLRCAQCCTLSPHLPPRAVRPDVLERDLARAASVLRPNVFKLTGGEPLLHPQLMRCLEVVRASGIADQVSVTTNGWLLDRVPAAFFERIDRLTLSHYSSAPLPEARLAEVEDRCRSHGVVLAVKRIDRFARMTPDPPFLSPSEAAVVHAGCWLKVRCHLLHQGRFYACTRPPHLEPYLRGLGVETDLATADGVALEAPRLLERLLRYLEGDEPLGACRYCLGAGGEFEAHRQAAPARPARRGAAPGYDGHALDTADSTAGTGAPAHSMAGTGAPAHSMAGTGEGGQDARDRR